MNRNRRFQQDTIALHKTWQQLPEGARGCRESLTFCEAFSAYAANRIRPCIVGKNILSRIGNIPVRNIDQALIDTLATEEVATLAPATMNRQIYTPISAVLKFAATKGWCAPLRLSRPRVLRRTEQLPTDPELDRFIHACAPHLKRIIIFLLRTDATVSETLELDWAHLDLVNGMACCICADGTVRILLYGTKIRKMFLNVAPSLRVGRVFLTHRGRPYKQKKNGGGHLKSGLAVVARKTGIKVNVRVLKRIRKARLNGERPDIPDDNQSQVVVASELKSGLTKCRERESNGSRR